MAAGASGGLPASTGGWRETSLSIGRSARVASATSSSASGAAVRAEDAHSASCPPSATLSASSHVPLADLCPACSS
eukprot:8462514-Heterocapsa_arctica.AAC.1